MSTSSTRGGDCGGKHSRVAKFEFEWLAQEKDEDAEEFFSLLKQGIIIVLLLDILMMVLMEVNANYKHQLWCTTTT